VIRTGEPHEKVNKDYLAKKIAEEIAKKTLKVNIAGYDRWYPYKILVKEPTPYLEWPYLVCQEFELDVLSDLGCYASEVDFVQIDMDIEVAWSPNRPVDSEGNPMYFPKTIPAGSTFKLENKVVEKLYIHAKATGWILIDVEGFTDC